MILEVNIQVINALFCFVLFCFAMLCCVVECAVGFVLFVSLLVELFLSFICLQICFPFFFSILIVLCPFANLCFHLVFLFTILILKDRNDMTFRNRAYLQFLLHDKKFHLLVDRETPISLRVASLMSFIWWSVDIQVMVNVLPLLFHGNI